MVGVRAGRRAVVLAALLLAAGCSGANSRAGGGGTTTTGGRTTTSAPAPSTTTTALPTTTVTIAVPRLPAPAPASAHFVVTPTVVRVGDKVTFSGTGCKPVGAVVLAYLQTGSNTGGTGAEITPHRDGTWSTTLDVADSTLLGASPAMAACAAAFNHATLFSYRPVTVQVSTFRTLRVTPATSVRPGTTLHIIASAGCPAAQFTGPSVTLMHLADFPGGSGIGDGAYADVTITAGLRPWSTDLTVPTGTAPGRYKVSAICTASRAVSAWYTTVPVTIVAG